MLVLDLAENLFQHVFERDDARRTAELVDHHGDVGAVLDEVFQQRLQRHGLRHEIGRHQHLPQIGRLAEQALGVDVSHDIVDTALPDEDARIFALDEAARQLFDARRQLDGLDVDARHHAVAHAQIGEVQRVLKQFDLVLLVVLHLRRPLDQTFEIGAVEVGRRRLPLHPAAEQPQDDVRNDGRKPYDRIEQDVKDEEQRREGSVIEIGISLDD